LIVCVWVSAPSSTGVFDVSKALSVSISGRPNPVYVDAELVGKRGLCRFQWKFGGNVANQGLFYIPDVSFVDTPFYRGTFHGFPQFFRKMFWYNFKIGHGHLSPDPTAFIIRRIMRFYITYSVELAFLK
jgi:hypothetical protein